MYTDRVSSNLADLRVVTVAQLDASEPRHRKIGNVLVQASLDAKLPCIAVDDILNTRAARDALRVIMPQTGPTAPASHATP